MRGLGLGVRSSGRWRQGTEFLTPLVRLFRKRITVVRGARLADIVLAAETTKGTFCGHFRNKLEVAKAIMFHCFAVVEGLDRQRVKLR